MRDATSGPRILTEKYDSLDEYCRDCDEYSVPNGGPSFGFITTSIMFVILSCIQNTFGSYYLTMIKGLLKYQSSPVRDIGRIGCYV